ncbi:MAG: class I SAM-dependent methyltransferase [Pseudomonadota bacterium]
MPAKLESCLDAVYQAGGERDKLDRVYDDWAKSYDQDLWASGNPYITIMAGMIGRHISDLKGKILDAGCGTGNLGEILSYLGYENVTGIDPSAGMLDAARAKGVYNALYQLLLGAVIDLPDNSFDGITAAGVLTHGHAPADSLDGMLRIAKAGAPIIFSISKIAEEKDGFGEKIHSLSKKGQWNLVEESAYFRTYPFSKEYTELRHRICVYRKSG